MTPLSDKFLSPTGVMNVLTNHTHVPAHHSVSNTQYYV